MFGMLINPAMKQIAQRKRTVLKYKVVPIPKSDKSRNVVPQTGYNLVLFEYSPASALIDLPFVLFKYLDCSSLFKTNRRGNMKCS